MPTPEWFDHLATWMRAATRGAERRDIDARCAALAAHPWTEADSRRADLLCRRLSVEAAAGPTPHPVVGRAVGLLDRALAGDEPSNRDRSDVGAAAGSVYAHSFGTAVAWFAVASQPWAVKSAAAEASNSLAAPVLAARPLDACEGVARESS